MEFNELIQDRFSCRALSDREIPREALDRILEAARVAPTAVNKQPFKIWAVESPEARAKLAETTNYTFGAGVFLVVGGKYEDAWVRQYDGRNFADVDPPSSRPTSCSPFTTRDCARHGSVTLTRPR